LPAADTATGETLSYSPSFIAGGPVAKGNSKSNSKVSGYHWATPRMWAGMTMGVWLDLFRRHGFKAQPKRIGMAAAITGFSACNSFWRMLSEGIYGRRAEALELEQTPLFVVGHWRSGTTLLHELLVLDDQFNYPNTMQCMIPDHFLLTEGLATFCFGWLSPGKRQMDNMAFGPDRPQEDEIALCNLGAPSPYLAWAYPDQLSTPEEYLDLEGLSEEQVERWKSALMFFLKRLTLKDPRRRQIVLKSPTHTARIGTLLEMFPRAKFVHITRDPYVVYLSTMRTWTSLSTLLGLSRVDDELIEEQVLRNFERMYRSFFRDRERLPAEQFHQVRYEDLVADPAATVDSIYRQLDLGDFEAVRGKIENFFQESKDYRPNKYTFDPALREKITARWGQYIRALGYSTETQGSTRETISSRSSFAGGLS
jgi:hypothetical protein